MAECAKKLVVSPTPPPTTHKAKKAKVSSIRFRRFRRCAQPSPQIWAKWAKIRHLNREFRETVKSGIFCQSHFQRIQRNEGKSLT